MQWSLLSAIQLAFEGHGLQAKQVENTLAVQDGLRLSPSVQVLKADDEDCRVQVCVRVTSTRLGNLVLDDCFAGLGKSLEEAEKNAFSKFLVGSFHVVAEALTTHRCNSGQVEWTHWSGPSASWRVCDGPLLTVCSGGSMDTASYPVTALRDSFVREASSSAHWLTLFVAFLDGKLVGCEAKIDGANWDSGYRILAGAPWTVTQGYQSVRHLLLALPDS
jgi:hypothetical protein